MGSRMCRKVNLTVLFLSCVLSSIQGEPWLIGPCGDFGFDDESDWRNDISLTGCQDKCTLRTNSTRYELAFWKSSKKCWCVPENRKETVSGYIEKCFKQRSEDDFLVEPPHLSFVLLLRYLRIKRLVLDATLTEDTDAPIKSVKFRAVCLFRRHSTHQDIFPGLTIDAYWFYNGKSVHVDEGISVRLGEKRRHVSSTWNTTLNSTYDGFINVVFSTGLASVSIERSLKFLIGVEQDVHVQVISQNTPNCIPPDFMNHLSDHKVFVGDDVTLKATVLYHALIYIYEWKLLDGFNVTTRSIESTSNVTYKFQEGLNEVRLTVTTPLGKIKKSIFVIALKEVSFSVQSKNSLNPFVGQNGEIELLSIVSNNRTWKAELQCNGIHKISTLILPTTDKDLCVRSNFIIKWKFNNPEKYQCQVYLTTAKLKLLSPMISFDVHSKIEMAVIKSKSFVKTNEKLSLTLALFPKNDLKNVSVMWTILNPTKNTSFTISNNHNLYFRTFLFDKPGCYIIKVTVSNPVSTVENETTLSVQDPITGLTINPDKPVLFIKQNSEISFNASYITGTEVQCTWFFRYKIFEPDTPTVHFEVTECSFVQKFYFLGDCKVSLIIRNKVSTIKPSKPWNVFVEDAITELEVSVPNAAILGTSVQVEVSVPRVQQEVFVVVGTRNRRAIFDAASSVYRTEIDLRNQTGIQWLRARAFNNVSRAVERIQILVVPEIGKISIHPCGCLAVGHKARFLVQVDGQFPSFKKHFLYKWHFLYEHVSTTAYSSVPLMETNVLTTVGTLTVTVFVRDEVQERNSSMSIYIPGNITSPCLQHEVNVQLNSPLEFRISGLSAQLKTENVTVRLLLTKDNRSILVIPQKITDTAQPPRWRYVSQSSGFHSIMAQVFLDDPNFISTNLCFQSGFHVQERLVSLNLFGPQTLRISRIQLAHEWHAEVTPHSKGSIFSWSLQNFEIISTRNDLTIRHKFDPGTHLLRLRVWNSLGHLNASMPLQTAVTLIALNITLTDFFVGRNGTFTLTFDRPPLDISFDFGDGVRISSRDHPASFQVSDAGTVTVHHVYRSAGLYAGHCKVLDYEKWVAVYVRVPIGGVAVELLSSSVVPLFEEVLVLCSVRDGSDLDFEWDFGDSTDGQYTMVNSTSNSSLANHSYGVADVYNVTVHVFNGYESVTAHLDVSIQAVEPIEKLHLRPRIEQYAAPLFERKSALGGISYSTDAVVFETWVWRGSDIYFLFDFGDGQTAFVPSELNVWSLPCATVKHFYTSEGAYEVSVTATNPLDSINQTLQQPFHVQFPPEGLALDRQYYIIQSKTNLTIRASITRGTNVSYNWLFGNEQLSETGDTLVLPYLRPGIHVVSVEAYNQVTDFAYKSVQRPMVSSKIYAQEKLKEIQLCLVHDNRETCNEKEIELPLDTEIKFVAKVLPSTERSLRFTWQLGVAGLKRSNVPVLHYQYQNPGRFIINVTAQNHISIVSSPPLVLHLIQKIANLTSILCQGPNIVNHVITFRALYWFGTNLTFQWDFGDGSSVVITNSSFIHHTYNEVGEYWVSVNIWNKFSHANFTSNMFFLHRFCQKPEIDFLDQNDRICSYADDILIEAEISTNCETSNVKYTWLVESAISTVAFDPEDLLHQRSLIIPKYYLQPGRYTISLKVEMVGFIVYAESSATISVQFPKTIAFIRGGYLRLMGRKDIVQLETSLLQIEDSLVSHSYTWSCSPFVQKHLSCFRDHIPEAFRSTEVESFYLPAMAFNPVLTAVVINVTVADEQLIPHLSSQVIEFRSLPHILLIDVECDSCHYNEINRDSKIQMKATCRNCTSSDLVYEWKIWMIEEGKHKMHFSNYKCVQADGSTFFIVAPNSTLILPAINNTEVAAPIYPEDWKGYHYNSSNQLIGDELPPFPNLPGFPEEINASKDDIHHRSVRDVPHDPHDFKIDPPDFFPYQQYPFEEEAHYDENSTLFNLSYPDFLPFPPHDHLLGNLDYPLPEEGAPGESGSAVARDQSAQRFNVYLSENEDHIEEGAGNPRIDGNSVYAHDPNQLGDPVRDSSIHQRPSTPHLLNRPRIAVTVDRSNTTTGFNSEYLILKPGVLRFGNSYLVEVDVRDRMTGLEGSAMEFLKVNSGPINGRCTLMPVKGHSLNFNFRLHCMEWRSESQPLYYELRYSLVQDDPGHLIYFGLNRNVKFVLPTGYESDSFNVYLNVIIRNNLGSSTKVCSLVREVEPLPLNCTLIQYVYNETFHAESQLARYLNEKQNQALFHRIHILSVSLNNYFHVKGLSRKDKILKEQIRFRFLELIENVKIFSKVEAIQALSCLSEIIADVSEITVFYLQRVYNIYLKFSDMRSQLYGYSLEDLQRELMVLASKLIHSAHSVNHRNEELIRIGRVLLINEIKEILKLRLRIEEPVVVELPHTFTSALYVSAKNQVKSNYMPLKNTQVQIAENFHLISKNEIKKCSEDDCQNCTALVAQEFDYVSMPHYLNFGPLLTSEKSSILFTFLTCDKLENIQRQKPWNFTVKFSRNLNGQVSEKSALLKDFAHVHQINLTEEDVSHSLIFHVILDNKTNVSENSYQMEVLLRYGNLPTPKKYDFKRTFPIDEKDHSFFVHRDYIKAPGLYYFALWTQFDSSSIAPSNTFSEYSIFIWKDVCLGKAHGIWSSHVCHSLDTSDSIWVDCNCSAQEITAYSTSLPYTFFLIPAKDFMEPYFNCVPLLVTIFISIVYFLLLTLNLKNDSMRNVSSSPIPLKDNASTHKQLYVMCVRTGMYFSSGTTASVFVVLHGMKGMTETRQLIDSKAETFSFQKGSVDLFLVSTAENLGPLIKVEVWHNNYGLSPSWYLKDITVKDLKTGFSYKFNCFNWISAEKGDGQIERELPVSDTTPSFRSVFLDNFVTYIFDYNMWNAVVVGCPASFFTGVQRLTCCLGFCINCAFLSSILQELLEKDYTLPHISPSSIPASLLISAISSLPQILLSVLFRFSRSPSSLRRPFSTGFGRFALPGLLRCWPRHKRSHSSSRSTAASETSSEGSDSLYSSFEESSAMSIPELMEESFTTEEKVEFGTSVSSDSVSDPVSPLQNTLSTWQAFENWVRKKHDLITRSDFGRQQISVGNDNVQISTEKSDSVLMSEEILLDEFQYHNANVNRDLGETESNVFRSASEQNLRQGMVANRNLDMQYFAILKNDLNTYLHKPFLPPFFYYMAWLSAIMNILVSSIFTFRKVFSFSSLECTLWLKHTFLATLCSVLIITPFMILLISLVATTKTHFQRKASKVPTPNDPQTKMTAAHEASVTDQTYKRIEYFKKYLRPPKEYALEQFRQFVMKEKRLFSFQSYVWQYILMFLLLMALSLPRDTKNRYLQRTSIYNAFFRTIGPSSWPKSMHPVTELQDWLESEVMDGLFGGECPDSNSDCGLTLSTGSILVGNAVIRLFETSCPQHLFYKNCYSFSSSNQSYGHLINYEQRVLSGQRGIYSLEDKLVILSSKEHEAEEQIELFASYLVDMKSGAAVSLELLLFNPSFSSLFSVLFLFEIDEADILFTSEILPVKLLDGTAPLYNVNFGLHLLFLCVTLIKMKNLGWHILKHGVSYWKNGWNCFSTLFDLISILYLIVYIFYMISFEITLSKLKETRFNTNIDVTSTAYLEQTSQHLLTFIIFFHLIRSLRVLYFSPRLKKLLNRIIMSSRIILSTFLIFLIFIFICDFMLRNTVGVTNKLSHPFIVCLNAVQSLFKGYRKPEIVNSDQVINKLFSSLILFVSIAFHIFLLAFLRSIFIGSKTPEQVLNKKITLKDTRKAIKRKISGYFQKQQPQLIDKDEYPLPIEFLLTELEHLTDTLLTKAENLFLEENTSDDVKLEDASALEGYLNHHCQTLQKDETLVIAEISNPLQNWNLALEEMTAQVAERLNITMPRKNRTKTKSFLPSSLNTSLGSQRKFKNHPGNISLSASLSHKIRKTYPLYHMDSESLSSDEDPGNGISLRKTKSRGKGKNDDLNVTILDDSSL